MTERIMMNQDDDFYKDLLDNLYDGVYFVDTGRRITYWNKSAERITGYLASEVVGKRCEDNILMHTDGKGNLLCKTGCPLSGTLLDGALRNTEVFLRHKDGHRVPVAVRVAPIRNADGETTGAVEIFTDNTEKAAALERMEEFEKLAYIDSLTGLANRRYAEINLNARHEEMQRYGWPFGVIFIDIDHFKEINDQYGHDVGDEVLTMVAKTLMNSARTFDVVGRWGGEEFLAIIANVNSTELIATANRFRMLVEQSSIDREDLIHVTISLGATLANPEETIPDLLKRVDGLMYLSKSGGRNRVTVDV